jgi:hypothetical protein
MRAKCGAVLSEIELRIPIVAISSLSWTRGHMPSILAAELEVAVHTAERIPSTSTGQSATFFCIA